jgi:hypothetical protein
LSSSFVVIFVVDHDRHEEDEAIVTILTQGRFISPSTISLLRRRGELNYEQLKLYEDGSKPLSDIGIKGDRPTQRFLNIIKKIPKKSTVESHDVDANESTSPSASATVMADSSGLSHHSRFLMKIQKDMISLLQSPTLQFRLSKSRKMHVSRD